MKLITKGRVLGIVALLAVAGLLWGGYELQKKIGAADDKPRYKTAEVDRGSIVQFVTATGTLNPVGLANVGTQVSGTVSEVNVDFNDRVKQGQVLLKIEPTLLQAVIKQNAASLNAARAGLKLAESNYNRNTKLVDQGFISATALEQLTLACRACRAAQPHHRLRISEL